jgi:integrase
MRHIQLSPHRSGIVLGTESPASLYRENTVIRALPMATIRKLRGRWQAQVRRRGVPPRAKSFDKRTDADRWARDLEAEVDRSGWVADTRAAEKTTLGELLARYANEVTPTKRGAVSEKARINSIVRYPIAHRTLAMLTSADVATYRDERLKTVAPATIIRELNTISHAIKVASREWGLWIPRNPVKLVRRPPVPRGRTRRLKEGEEQSLLEASDRGRTPLLRPLIILAIETAMRRGELLDLRWQHVDFKLSVAHLPLTKNGDSRDVPLSRRAVQTMQQLRADGVEHERVFPMTGNAVRLAFEHLRVRAGMSDFHFHDLRHEAISRLFKTAKWLSSVTALQVRDHSTPIGSLDGELSMTKRVPRGGRYIGLYGPTRVLAEQA